MAATRSVLISLIPRLMVIGEMSVPKEVLRVSSLSMAKVWTTCAKELVSASETESLNLSCYFLSKLYLFSKSLRFSWYLLFSECLSSNYFSLSFNFWQ